MKPSPLQAPTPKGDAFRSSNGKQEAKRDLKTLQVLFNTAKIRGDSKIRIDSRDANTLLEFAKNHLPFSLLIEASRTIGTAAVEEQKVLTKRYEKNLKENAKLDLTNEEKGEYAHCVYYNTLIQENKLEALIKHANNILPKHLRISSNFDPSYLWWLCEDCNNVLIIPSE
jgi:hypothetical protein